MRYENSIKEQVGHSGRHLGVMRNESANRRERLSLKPGIKTLSSSPEKGRTRLPVFKIVKETAKAYLVLVTTETIWLPKSQVKIGLNQSKTLLMVDMPDWLYQEKVSSIM